jgi:hypothetical protein
LHESLASLENLQLSYWRKLLDKDGLCDAGAVSATIEDRNGEFVVPILLQILIDFQAFLPVKICLVFVVSLNCDSVAFRCCPVYLDRKLGQLSDRNCGC